MSHIHAIFNHKGKNLLKTDKVALEYSDKNEFTHLYTLQVNPDGTYEIFFDMESKAKGKLVDDWDFPKPMIDDPSDSKPSDWVDEKVRYLAVPLGWRLFQLFPGFLTRLSLRLMSPLT